MVDNPVAGGHEMGWRRLADHELLGELGDLFARADRIPDGVLVRVHALCCAREWEAPASPCTCLTKQPTAGIPVNQTHISD